MVKGRALWHPQQLRLVVCTPITVSIFYPRIFVNFPLVYGAPLQGLSVLLLGNFSASSLPSHPPSSHPTPTYSPWTANVYFLPPLH